MAAESRIIGPQCFVDPVRFLAKPILPAKSLGNDQIADDANIDPSKLGHQHAFTFAQNGVAGAETRALHVAAGNGTVMAFSAGSIGVCTGDATITIDLKKNGVSILAAPIVLDSSKTARVAESGTLVASPTVAAGDLLEIVVTVSAGTGALGTGLYASLVVNESAAT